MCYNYSNYVKVDGLLVNKYKLRIGERYSKMKDFAERYGFAYTNGFAHADLPIITIQKPDEIQSYKWGLIPHWVKGKETDKGPLSALQIALDTRALTLNATCENVFVKPSFKPYIKTRRCLVPATGFFEWHHKSKTEKIPYHILVKDDLSENTVRCFCFGGLYSTWIDPDGGEVFNTFAIVTTPANEMMEFIHNNKKRMPLILREEDESKWLDPSLNEEELIALMRPLPKEHLTAYTISKRITGREERNVPEVLDAARYDGVPNNL